MPPLTTGRFSSGFGPQGITAVSRATLQPTCLASIGNRAEVNFALAERSAKGGTYFGRLRREREKNLRDPQDALIEADRLRQQLKKRRAQRRMTSQQ
jgi:hypothetical protein